MTDLDRRALMGDKKAQEECTEKGIALPCPFCGGKAEIIGVDNSNPFTVWCDNCGLEFGMGKDYHYYQIVETWNTRQAPPIGRCKDCMHYNGLAECEFVPECGGTNWFCGWFEPRCEE